MVAASFHRSYIFLLLWLQQYYVNPVLANKEVYFNSYGDCSKMEPFDLDDEEYTLKHIGGTFAHETLVCNISFKAPTKFGVCLKFEKLEIEDCKVRINIYRLTKPKENLWRTFDCRLDSMPTHMCTSERAVKIQVKKSDLNSNRGYRFEIEVEKSDNVSDESVLIASIGVFISIILGVVVFIALLGLTIVYCCCKRRNRRQKRARPLAEQQTLVPTAPPLESLSSPPQLYPKLETPYNPDLPPPYVMSDVPPPPYESEINPLLNPQNDPKVTSQSYPQTQTSDDDQTLPLKQ
ncbi:hypothetical protein BgiBS90_017549 [Biomphalaria glabrata]|nr:hypothetical protein BgiBS90_017549 [Biomphalaria glabrata]